MKKIYRAKAGSISNYPVLAGLKPDLGNRTFGPDKAHNYYTIFVHSEICTAFTLMLYRYGINKTKKEEEQTVYYKILTLRYNVTFEDSHLGSVAMDRVQAN